MLTKHLNGKVLGILLAAFLATTSGTARAQDDIFVSDIYGQSISEYTLNGAPVADPLVSGPVSPTLDGPYGMAISGTTLYVSNWASNTISQFNVLTGAPVSTTPFISGDGLSDPSGLLLDGNTLYVANIGNDSVPYQGSIEEFNATTGALIGSGPLISGLTYTTYMTLSGNDLYVSNWSCFYDYNAATGALIGNGPLIPYIPNAAGLAINGNTLYVADSCDGDVVAYNATTGKEIGKHPLITGLDDPSQVVFDDGDLYVSDVGTDTIQVYDAKTGKEIGCQPLICGAANPYNFIIADPADPVAVPEPTTWAMLLSGLLLFVFTRRLRARTPIL